MHKLIQMMIEVTEWKFIGSNNKHSNYPALVARQQAAIDALEQALAERDRLREAAMEAHGGLRCADVQSLPSDDQIIMGHVREAANLLEAALRRIKAQVKTEVSACRCVAEKRALEERVAALEAEVAEDDRRIRVSEEMRVGVAQNCERLFEQRNALETERDALAATCQGKDDAIADLRAELEDERKPNVVRGKEAEELRQAIEALLEEEWANGDYPLEALSMEEVKGRLQRILDTVDARDSLAYLEARGSVRQEE